jgi:hypothetical protein
VLVGLVAAGVIGGVLVAPVIISGGSSTGCSTSLYYLGRPYTAREVAGAPPVQAIAIGVGVTRGCGTKPESLDVRSLAGVTPSRAIGVSGASSSIYVRRGICPRASARTLLACVTR